MAEVGPGVQTVERTLLLDDMRKEPTGDLDDFFCFVLTLVACPNEPTS